MARRALYYPERHVQDPRFLFEALLYWDQLACIRPFSDVEPDMRGSAGPEFAGVLADAHERFVTGVVPTNRIKEQVHDRVSSLLDVSAPHWCRPDAWTGPRFAIVDLKLHGETRRLLLERGWASEWTGDEGDLILSRAAGYVVMSELAAALSTPHLPLITENPSKFRGICNALLWRIGASRAVSFGEGQREQTTEQPEATFLVTRFTRLAWDTANVKAA